MQTDDPKQAGVAKTHPHHHATHHHPRGPGPKLAPKATDLSAALENMHISTHDGKPGSAAAHTAPPGQQQHLHPNAHLNANHLAPQGINNNPRSAGFSPPHSANRSAGPGGFSPSLNDFVAAQNGARLLAALAAGPGGMPAPFPQPAPNAPGRQQQPAPLAFPGHPIGMPLGLPAMPLTPPAAAAYFPQLSAGHPPLYDFAALQQQHLLELAAAQQAAQGAGAISPPANLTPGVSPATGQRNDQNAINAAAIALLQQSVPPGFAPFPGAGFGGPGFYPSPTDPSYNPELAAAMARAIPQYTAALAAAAAAQAQYGNVDMNTVAALNLAGSPNGANGPSANNRKLGLYKTELCRSWEEKGTCRYGPKCQFAHGEEELRKVQRHPKYKTEICRTFWVSGSCPYGKRCCFIHTELPGPGGAGAEGATTPNGTSAPAVASATPNNAANAPERTPSANSSNADGTEKEQSLLARINAKRDNKDDATTPTFQVSRPGLGGLRVDTSALDGGAAVKQNKSAFPTFASNQTIPSVDSRNEAPPATAGPEFGRQRLEVLGLPKGGNTHSRSLSGSADTTTGSLHQSSRSLSGAGNLTPLVAGNTPDSATAPTQAPVPAPAVSHGHSRSTSGSQWRPGATGQGQVGAPTLGALSAFPRESNEANPWAQAATAAPTGRYPNRAWAS